MFHIFAAALAHDDVRDFEDLLQCQCAAAAGCDVIVTNTAVGELECCLVRIVQKLFVLFS